jgi:heat shock protein HtpX
MLKTFLLLGLMSALMVTLGNVLGGHTGMLVMLVISFAMNFFSYWYSDKLVIKMTGAQPLSQEQAPDIHRMVEEISRNAGLPMPKLYITRDLQPNAFATGRNPEHASVAVTQGLMQILDAREIKGVLAHEMAHIKNRDILIGSVAAMMAAVISYMAQMAQWAAIFGSNSDEDGENIFSVMIMAILGPIAALLIQMAISRSREFQADATGARLAGDTGGLANALMKLDMAAQRIPMQSANPSTAHMYISNPLRGGGMMSLFSTHPTTQARVERLQQVKL